MQFNSQNYLQVRHNKVDIAEETSCETSLSSIECRTCESVMGPKGFKGDISDESTGSSSTDLRSKLTLLSSFWEKIPVKLSATIREIVTNINQLAKCLKVRKKSSNAQKQEGRSFFFRGSRKIHDVSQPIIEKNGSKRKISPLASKEEQAEHSLKLRKAVALDLTSKKMSTLGIRSTRSDGKTLSQLKETVIDNASSTRDFTFRDTAGTVHSLAFLTLGNNREEKLFSIKKYGEGGFATIHRLTDTDGTTFIEKKPRRTAEAKRDLAYEYKNLLYLNRNGTQDGIQLRPLSAQTHDGKEGMIGRWYNQGDLSKFTQKLQKPLTTKMYIEHSRQLSSGLSFLHKNQMRHGDLKPINVLVKSKHGGEFRVDIADFGGARTKEDFRLSVQKICGEHLLDLKRKGAGPEEIEEEAALTAVELIHTNGGSQIGIHPNSYQELSEIIECFFKDALENDEANLQVISDRDFEEIWELEQKRDVYALGVILLSHILGVNEYKANCEECSTVTISKSPFYLVHDIDFVQLKFNSTKTRDKLLKIGLEEEQIRVLLRSVSADSNLRPTALDLKKAFT